MKKMKMIIKPPKRDIFDRLVDRFIQRTKNFIQVLPEKDPLNTRMTGVFSHIILWSVFLFIVVFIVWAHFARIDEVTRALGYVIPSRKTQVIQNLEGGIVKEVLVKEGQIVNKNQILMFIDDTKFASDYRSELLHADILSIKIARLKAEFDNKPFEPTAAQEHEMPDIVETEEHLYHSRKAELTALNEHRRLLSREINLTEPLIKTGAASEVELLRLQQQYHDLTMRINSFNSATMKELNEAKSAFARLNENNIGLKDRLDRTIVRSPVKGIVKQIYVATIGGVIKSGMALMEIVPIEDTLLIEARVKPNDIGFIHPGQKAVVKITAYDYSIYGGLIGKIEHISADTTLDKRDNPFYEIRVKTDKNYLLKGKKELRIIPGMQASVDILTGEKTVMDYLLKPILKAKYTALRER